MEFIKKVKEFFSSVGNIVTTIIVGIISILGFLTLVRKSSEKKEEKTFKDIEQKKEDNKNIDVELNKIEGKIDFLEEKEEALLEDLKNETKDNSENLEDFFNKRGF